MSSKLIYLTGGIRGGQRRHALQKSKQSKSELMYLFACSNDTQDELFERRKSYVVDDGGKWNIVSESLSLAYEVENGGFSKNKEGFLIIDDLSIWVHNLIYRQVVMNNEEMLQECKKLLEALNKREGTTYIITEEVGMGCTSEINDNPFFRDILGIGNKFFAENASEAYLMVSGQAIKLG